MLIRHSYKRMPTIAVDYVWMVSVDKMSQMTITNSFDWKSKAKRKRMILVVIVLAAVIVVSLVVHFQR